MLSSPELWTSSGAPAVRIRLPQDLSAAQDTAVSSLSCAGAAPRIYSSNTMAAAAGPQIRVALVDQRVVAREEWERERDDDDSEGDWEAYCAPYYTDEGHRCGELGRCVQHVKATIALDGEQAGSIELVLVDRNFRGDFHEICDAESQELVDVAIALFDRDGATPRLRALEELDEDVGEGIFAYVSKLRVDAPDPRCDVATEALRQLRDLVGGWNVATYICEGEPHYAPDARALAKRRYRGDSLTPEETRALEAAERKGVLRDKVPFLRAGFRAADELRRDYELLFCTKSTWRDPPASYESVSTEAAVTQRQVLALGCVSNRRDAGINMDLLRKIHVFLAPAPPKPAPAELSSEDATLRQIMMNMFQAVRYGGPLDDSAFYAELSRRAAQDGDVRCLRRANALHCASICPPAAPLVASILAQVGPDAIDDRDESGYTPLMVGAGTIAGMGNATHPPDLSMLRALVAAGADTSLTDRDGLTALGLYRKQVGMYNDHWNSMGVDEDLPRRNPEIEGLLMPPDGPTAADLRATNPHT